MHTSAHPAVLLQVSGPNRTEQLLRFFGRILGLYRLTDRYSEEQVEKLSWEERRAHAEGPPRPEQRLFFRVYLEAVRDAYRTFDAGKGAFRSAAWGLQQKVMKGTLTEKTRSLYERRLCEALLPMVEEILWFRNGQGRKVVYLWEWGRLSNDRLDFSDEFSRLASDYLIADLCDRIPFLSKYISRDWLLRTIASARDASPEEAERITSLIAERFADSVVADVCLRKTAHRRTRASKRRKVSVSATPLPA
ncbi:hypothetical protein [Thermosulfurimonas sp. F29]|uniref:hypothetical protein n=1 Tax=Thermosulfurimonas sp. F29 TaxID=2867247 RepID=UPI001C831D2F|nr:hypothetical protein [Thermosulfurimonas sp. F29]MBX6424196.1 hypothetical protein [Thermosulfurimonas sp. F29]